MAQPEESAPPKKEYTDNPDGLSFTFGTLKVVKGLSSLNAIYYILCFEFEIPNKKNDKNLNTIDEELEVEPELEKVQEPVTVSVK